MCGMVFKYLYSAPQRPWANRDGVCDLCMELVCDKKHQKYDL